MATFDFKVIPVQTDGIYVIDPSNNTATAIKTYLNAQGALGYQVVRVLTLRDGQQKVILQKES